MFKKDKLTSVAKDKIKTCKQGDHTTLNLKSCQLEKIPFSLIKKCQNLNKIDFSSNFITIVKPKFFQRFLDLVELDLSNNGIIEIPPQLLLLKKLTKLNLYGNALTEIPSPLSELPMLTFLDVGANPLSLDFEALELSALNLDTFNLRSLAGLTQVPPVLLEMKEITHLDMKGNDICSLFDDFGDLAGCLVKLDLSDNRLKSLSFASLATLQCLKVLDLSRNPIGESIDTLPFADFPVLEELLMAGCYLIRIPDTIGQCRSLIKLDLSCNRLEELPYEFGFIGKGLRELNLSENMLEILPGSFYYLDENIRLDLGRNNLKPPYSQWLSEGVPRLIEQMETKLSCDPSQCECIGEFNDLPTNTDVTFSVQGKDMIGISRTSGGEKFLGAIMGSSGDLVEHIFIDDMKDGTYTCTFKTPMRAGNYQVVVTYGRTHHILGSPFQMTLV